MWQQEMEEVKELLKWLATRLDQLMNQEKLKVHEIQDVSHKSTDIPKGQPWTEIFLNKKDVDIWEFQIGTHCQSMT